MEILIKRKIKKNNYTIGDLFIDGQWFCNTLEDADRGLLQTDSIYDIQEVKNIFPERTAIPKGQYKMSINVISPKYSTIKKFKSIGGKMPRLLDVPGFTGVLIHTGNTAKDSQGCILVGLHKEGGTIINSTATFFGLYKELEKDRNNITLKIE